ncbi:MAG: ABC transporter permease [Mobilicoccus sp.]|nr:ABC transporter permease [Mobilicoccus sp.]
MTAPAATRPARPAGRARGGSFAGTGSMLRLMLRRDRIWFPAWVLGNAAMAGYYAVALQEILTDHAAMASMVALMASPVTAMVGGPGYGFDDPTVPRLIAGIYGLYIMLGAALMSLLTISRHTRVEEQTGRVEALLADAVGRRAPLTAALLLVTTMQVLLSALVGGIMIGAGFDPAPSVEACLLFGVSIGAAGLVFAGVAAVTAQLSPFSRTCSALAGLVLGASFALRGIGDMAATHDGDLAVLSWFSPLGWSQQTAPFTLDRWWPLLFSLAATIALVSLAYVLAGRRDVGAGFLADRPGRPHAGPLLGSALGLAWRLQLRGVIGWTVALTALGLLYGAFTQPMIDGTQGMPEEILLVLGGTGGLADGYVGFMAVFDAIVATVFVILAALSLRGEERSTRLEAVLATKVSRAGWVLAWASVTAVGSLLMVLGAGLGVGVGAAVGTGDADLLKAAVLGHLAQVPAVWLVLGVAICLYGVAPRLLGLVWVLYGYACVITMFGPMMRLEQAVLDTSIYNHAGRYPAEDISWIAVGLMALVAVVLVSVGAAAFRRRDLT